MLGHGVTVLQNVIVNIHYSCKIYSFMSLDPTEEHSFLNTISQWQRKKIVTKFYLIFKLCPFQTTLIRIPAVMNQSLLNRLVLQND